VNKRSEETVNDQLFCWEQVSSARPLFRMTRIFAPAGLKEKLLPLHALLAIVEMAGSQYSDEDLARSKLHWWRSQLLGRDPAASPHPVMRELARTGAAERMLEGPIKALLDDAERRLDAEAPVNLDELLAHCRALHQPQCALEASVAGLSPDELPWIGEGDAAAGLLQLLRESTRRPAQAAYWWLPLQLLARHGVARGTVGHAGASEPIGALFRDIITAVERYADAAEQAPGGTGGQPANARHLAVDRELGTRKLRRMSGLAPGAWPAELLVTRLGDLLAAWKTARRYTV
jgi:phytoene synthase